MMYSRIDYNHYMEDRVLDDHKKDNLASWLRRDMELFKIDKNEEDDHHYHYTSGFIVYWDYILNFTKEELLLLHNTAGLAIVCQLKNLKNYLELNIMDLNLERIAIPL